KELGLDLDFEVLDDATPAPAAALSYAVTVIGDGVDAACIHEITACLAKLGANIDAIERLSDRSLSSLEIVISLARDEDRAIALRRDLVAIAGARGVDLAVQRETLTRRAKRLVVMDMDSTLIRIEVIDEL